MTEFVVEWECLTVRTGEQLASCYHIAGLGGYDESFREVCAGASAAASIATLVSSGSRKSADLDSVCPKLGHLESGCEIQRTG